MPDQAAQSLQIRRLAELPKEPAAMALVAWRRIGVQVPGKREHAMNILLWVLQGLAAALYAMSGVMKVFLFDKVSGDVTSFGALPKPAWMTLGVVELVCVVGLIVPSALRWYPMLTVAAAAVLAVESLIFIGVHMRYKETGPIVMCAVLGLLMAFVAYGRMALSPIG
jgi:uncharacterized membrane protein YphA (DoxX/SURF4 family)